MDSNGIHASIVDKKIDPIVDREKRSIKIL